MLSLLATEALPQASFAALEDVFVLLERPLGKVPPGFGSHGFLNLLAALGPAANSSGKAFLPLRA